MFNADKVCQVLCLTRRIGGQTQLLSIAAAKKAIIGIQVTIYSTSNFFKKPAFPDRHYLYSFVPFQLQSLKIFQHLRQLRPWVHH